MWAYDAKENKFIYQRVNENAEKLWLQRLRDCFYKRRTLSIPVAKKSVLFDAAPLLGFAIRPCFAVWKKIIIESQSAVTFLTVSVVLASAQQNLYCDKI